MSEHMAPVARQQKSRVGIIAVFFWQPIYSQNQIVPVIQSSLKRGTLFCP